MTDPQVAIFASITISIFCSMLGAAVAIFAAVQSARQPAKSFDFAASARRIRAARF